MLVSQNYFDRSNSKYQCDRCKTAVSLIHRYTIYVGEGTGTPHKRWDLCMRCFKALERGTERSK